MKHLYKLHHYYVHQKKDIEKLFLVSSNSKYLSSFYNRTIINIRVSNRFTQSLVHIVSY